MTRPVRLAFLPLVFGSLLLAACEHHATDRLTGGPTGGDAQSGAPAPTSLDPDHSFNLCSAGATGRLLYVANGASAPLAGEVWVRSEVDGYVCTENVTSDADGRFTLSHLARSLSNPSLDGTMTIQIGTRQRTLSYHPSASLSLGDIEF